MGDYQERNARKTMKTGTVGTALRLRYIKNLDRFLSPPTGVNECEVSSEKS